MERVQGARTPYEVYCYHCRVTFPREARRCVHCGGRLGPPGRSPEQHMAMGQAPEPEPARSRSPDPRREDPPEDDVEETPASLLVRRFGGLAVWAVLALAAVLSNMCQGRG